MLPITLIILLIDVMPEFLLFYHLEYLHHNYSVQYLKLVSFLIGTMPPDSVITCLCEFWQSAIKQCYLQKEKNRVSLCVYVYLICESRKSFTYSYAELIDLQAVLKFEPRKKKYCSTWREQIFHNVMFFQVLLQVDLVFLELHPHHVWQKPLPDTWAVNTYPIINFYLWNSCLWLCHISINEKVFLLASVFSIFKHLSKT